MNKFKVGDTFRCINPYGAECSYFTEDKEYVVLRTDGLDIWAINNEGQEEWILYSRIELIKKTNFSVDAYIIRPKRPLRKLSI